MTREELIIELEEANAKNAEIEGDIRAVVSVFASVIGALGIDAKTLEQDSGDFSAMIPKILQKVMLKIGTGGLDTQAFGKIGEIAPVLNKYKHLVEDIIDEKKPIKA